MIRKCVTKIPLPLSSSLLTSSSRFNAKAINAFGSKKVSKSQDNGNNSQIEKIKLDAFQPLISPNHSLQTISAQIHYQKFETFSELDTENKILILGAVCAFIIANTLLRLMMTSRNQINSYRKQI